MIKVKYSMINFYKL